MASTPRIDNLESNQGGLSVALQTPVVNLTYLTAVNSTPGAGQFRSTITGRGRMVDLSNDLMPRIGIERIQTQSVMRVDGEIGPNGETVYKLFNDKFDQVRFAGGIINIPSPTSGAAVYLNAVGDFVEITFYGTGLNILTMCDSNTRSLNISVDGGGSSLVTFATASNSGTLQGRNYASNQIINLVNGLSLGIHTVKGVISSGQTCQMFGFEILNESSSVKTSAGTSSIAGKLLTLASVNSQAYNSSFDSGTLGTRGGRVVVYQKSDGTIGKSVTPTNASSATFASADHSNEEVVRAYHPREFGAGRSDDFSTLVGSASSRSFTLDDGTTTLYGVNSSFTIQNGVDCLLSNGGGTDAWTIVFVGTGLDVIVSSNGGARTDTVQVDGVAIGSLVQNTVAGLEVRKIVSGLPYGTHTVRFTSGGGSSGIRYAQIITYGPKKPSLPSAAVELADYNIMATYVANTAFAGTATGVLRKISLREHVFLGTGWAYSAAVPGSSIGGAYIDSSTNGDSVKLTFWGTGFEYRFYQNGGTNVVSIDGSSNLSGFTTSIYHASSLTFTPATGVLANDSGTRGAGLQVSGLTLGLHTVAITKTSASLTSMEGFDVITPIHVHKNNGPIVLQNTLSVGSQGVGDLRSLPKGFTDSSTMSNAAQVLGAVPNTSSTHVPLGDMTATIYVKEDSILDVSFCGMFASGSSSSVNGFKIEVDGEASDLATPDIYGVWLTANHEFIITLPAAKIVKKGWHHVKFFYRTNFGTLTALGGVHRSLKVRAKPLQDK